MFGFDPVTLPALYVLASMSACPAQGPVAVDVHLQKADNAYITNQSSQQLTALYGRDPDASMATDGRWMVGGVTVVSRGGLQHSLKAEFKTLTNYAHDTVCFTVASVEDEIQYSPQIYIASDFLNLGCRYSATLMHEKRHVDADVRTFTDFAPYMRDKIERTAEALPPQGPVPVNQLEEAEHDVLKQLSDSIGPLRDQMLELRRKRNAAIDTLPNYLRDTALCPGQFPKFDGTSGAAAPAPAAAPTQPATP